MSNIFRHEFFIAADHPCFEGHFPAFPVFPAVGQLSLLVEALGMFHDRACEITAIPVAKFLSPVGPDTAVTVELTSKGENSADFSLISADGVVAKGKLGYRIVEP